MRRGTILLEAEDDLLLPDDGIVDPIAVETLAHGWRKIRSTKTERLMAVEVLLRAEAEPAVDVIADRLHVTSTTAWRLIQEVRDAGNRFQPPSVSATDVN